MQSFMPKKTSLLLGGFLFLLACSKKEELPVEENLLIETLIDIHLAESAMLHEIGSKKDSLATLYYDQVMQIHGMDRAVFDTCIAILRRNPALMQEIYAKVGKELEKKKKELESQ
jgi:hypothetical protein